MRFEYLWAKVLKKIRGRAILRSEIDPTAVVYSGSQVIDCVVGRYSYIAYDSSVVNAEIGKFCSIAQNVVIGSAEHPMDWVSTSPVFENVRNSGPTKRFSKFDVPPVKRTHIGSDVWIGYGAIIKGGVKIGHGAVVGAGAVVTKDVPPYAVVGGCPAKVIKYRFDEPTISDLLTIKWWDFSDDKLSSVSDAIKNPQEFIGKLKDINSL